MTTRDTAIHLVQHYLQHPEVLEALWEQLDYWILHDPPRVLELGQYIGSAQQQAPSFELSTLYRDLIKSVCIGKHPDLLDIGLQLLLHTKSETLRQEGVSRLASEQEHGALLRATIPLQDRHLLWLVTHEVIARGSPLVPSVNTAMLQQHFTEAGLPLLPLIPLPEEEFYSFPFFASRTQSQTVEFGFPLRGFQAINRRALPSIDLHIHTQLNYTDAVAHWCTNSNGSIVMVMGSFRQALPPEHWLPSLPPFLACEGITIKRRCAAQSAALLFNAASNSGAHGHHPYGAVGRLNAWNTLRTLLQCPLVFPVEDVAHVMQQASWWEFNTDTWFYNDWLDLGLAATWVNDEGRTQFGILAATDTD